MGYDAFNDNDLLYFHLPKLDKPVKVQYMGVWDSEIGRYKFYPTTEETKEEDSKDVTSYVLDAIC